MKVHEQLQDVSASGKVVQNATINGQTRQNDGRHIPTFINLYLLDEDLQSPRRLVKKMHGQDSFFKNLYTIITRALTRSSYLALNFDTRTCYIQRYDFTNVCNRKYSPNNYNTITY